MKNLTVDLPFTIKQNKTFNFNIGKWEWQKTDPIKLNKEVISEVKKILSAIYDSFNSGNPDLLIPFTEKSVIDLSNSYGSNVDKRIERIANFVRNFYKSKRKLVPLSDIKFALRLCANNKLIDCIADDYNPIIRSYKDEYGGEFFYSVKIGRINKKWYIFFI